MAGSGCLSYQLSERSTAMRAIILDGALKNDSKTAAIAESVQQVLASTGWIAEVVALREQKAAYCLGCFDCWTKSPGICRIDDDGRTVTAAMLASDLAIYLTPLTFGGYSSELKKALDRSICLVSPFFTRIEGEVHHKARYDCYPAILGVGVTTAYNEVQAAIFARLIERNALNLHAPAHAAIIVHNGAPATTTAAALAQALAHMNIDRKVIA
jgi:multimeric flavodoxin WrbA